MDERIVNKTSVMKKYSIAHSKKLGRYLVAAKDLAAGELIFCEDAVAVGPATFVTGVFCFGCMRLLPDDHDDWNMKKKRYMCSKCNVAPLCDRVCEKLDRHHSARECSLFREKRQFCLENLEELQRNLLHLRLWLLKHGGETKEGTEVWSQLQKMESHLEKRRKLPVWQERETGVVQMLRKLGLENTEEAKREALQRLCGLVDVNTFELRAPDSSSDVGQLRGLFLGAALMAHDCRANGHLAVDADFRMTLRAARAIPAGQPISFNYTSSLLGTAERQEHLQQGKYFRCECEACEDPFEAGSYLSCILCPRCSFSGKRVTAYVAPQNPSKEIDPYSRRAKWQCQRCKRVFAGCLVRTTVETSKDLVEHVDPNNFKAMEALLDKLSRTFHANHFVVLSLKQKMLYTCRKELSRMKPRRRILERMRSLCGQLIELLDVVEPGVSRLKGVLLYEVHLPTVILANRAYGAREIDASELLKQLEEAREQLRRALALLLLEPTTTPEGQLARQALKDLRLLGQSIEDARTLPGVV